MQSRWRLLILSVLILTACSQSVKQLPPRPQKIDHPLTTHGQTRIDPYYWLNQRDNPEVLAHLHAENAYAKTMMQHTEKLQETLYEEMTGRIKQNDDTVPWFKNGYYYYTRYETGQEYPIYCRKQASLDNPEEIMLNVNDMAAGKGYYSVAGLSVSPDNQWLAFGIDTLSRRKYTLRFKNLRSGEMAAVKIANTSANFVWANDNHTLFYVAKDSTLRPFQVWKHRLGSDPAADTVVYSETDNTFNVSLGKSKTDRWLFITSEQTLSSEYRYLDAGTPDDAWRIFQPRQRGLEYSVHHDGDRFLIVTNLAAQNFRLMSALPGKTGVQHWQEVIGHRADVLLESIEPFRDFLVVSERANALRRIRIIEKNSGLSHDVDFGEQAYVAYVSDNPEYDRAVLRYRYTSLTTPWSVYDYDLRSHERQLRKQDEVVGGYNPQDYYTERLFAPARDGVRIPLTLVYKKGLQKDGGNPCLLYGYGSYGASMDPTFSSDRLSLLDRGFVYAIAHIRGGQELGRAWYDDGKLLKKKNTFYDFIDCAEFLIQEGYTKAEHLAALGGSAGGLLMGAVVNLRPDLFHAVIAAVPWVDVVTTMLDESIPLTTAEYDEWGNPNVKDYYEYMLSYSPYDNVSSQAYPDMLVTTGLHDSQVQYFEPVKWVAKLRDLKTDKNVLIMDIDMESGHGGASGRFKRFHRLALQYAFLLDQMQIRQ